MKLTNKIIVAATVATFLVAGRVEAETPNEVINAFTAQDIDAAWMKNRRYMRHLDDESWKDRMLAMQKLVAGGKASVPALLAALKSEDDNTRVFAAQTLGYLAPHVERKRLLEIAKQDAHAAVRLYAVDAVGMQGGIDPMAELAPLKETEKNRDVLKHIGYAMERKEQGIAGEVVDTLKNWDPALIDSAQVGKAAPDFELATPEGMKIRLSDFRSKKPVVLVFVYGDT